MRDAYNEHGDEQLKVHAEGDGGPYLIIEPSQVADVRAVLDSAGITYGLSPDAIRLDGRPAGTVFNFGNGADVDKIQAALDAAD